MDIMQRIDMMKEYGVADQTAYEDLLVIVSLMNEHFGITLTEDNAGVMITHLAAAFQRGTKGEEVAPIATAALEGLHSESNYPQSCRIAEAICTAIQNRLSTREQDYLVLHLCTLLYGHNNK